MTRRRSSTNFALIDTAFLSDSKFRALYRKAKDDAEFWSCVGVWLGMLTECRRSRSPEVTLANWEDVTYQVSLLREVLLLGEAGFSQESFEAWAPASRYRSDRYGEVPALRETTESTVGDKNYGTSTPFSSTPPTNGKVAREESQLFMGYRPKPNEHFGQHEGCGLCLPIQEAAKAGKSA